MKVWPVCVFLGNACQGEIVEMYYGYETNNLECAACLIG